MRRVLSDIDLGTIKAVLLYIIEHSGVYRHDVYSIVKTAYYAQQMHLAKWALPLFNDKISALPFGPVPSLIYNILKTARGDQEARRFLGQAESEQIAASIGFENEMFSALEPADLNFLSTSNIDCLDAAIEKVDAMSFDEICKDTHGAEWLRAYNSSSKVMDDVSIAAEGGASAEALQYLRESLQFARSFD